MKIFDIDWHAFLQALHRYRRLPFAARRIFVQCQPSQTVPNAALGEWREPLLESELMAPGPQGKNLRVEPRYQGLSRVLRAMSRSRIFHTPSRETFHAFVTEHFEGPELSSFFGP